MRIDPRVLCGLVLVLAACGEPPPVVPDAGADAGPSTEPAPPVLTPCPPGWREVLGDHGVMLCEPWPEGGRVDDCAVDQAHLPGTPGCARIGAPCGPDGWPVDLPTDRPIVYVRAGAAGGDGSQASPLALIRDAVEIAARGSVIAIGAGRYDEMQIFVDEGVTLWGACTADTVLTSTTPSDENAMVFLAEDGAEVRNLRIEQTERPAIIADATDVRVRDVIVDGARAYALGIPRGSVEANGLVVRAMRSGDATRGGRAFEIQGDAAVVVRGGRIDRALELGVSMSGAGARFEAHDFAVTRTVGFDDGTVGYAIGAIRGSEIQLHRTVLEDGNQREISVDGGLVLEATDLVIRGTDSPTQWGSGLTVFEATVRLTRARIDDVQGVGIAAEGGARLELRDAVVRDVRADFDGELGRGIDVLDGATALIERVLVARASDGAVAISRPGSELVANDLVILDVRGRPDGRFGRGIVAQIDGRAVIERALIDGAGDIGVQASGALAALEARHLVIRGLRGTGLGERGYGAWAEGGARLTLLDSRIEGARMAGAGATGGALLTLLGTTITGTREAACAPAGCEFTGGFGLAAPYGGMIIATDFEVLDSAVCAVVVGETGGAGPSSVDLMRGVISGAPVGACVQAEDFDVTRLRNEVMYRDVGIPLQATTYTLPDSLGEL